VLFYLLLGTIFGFVLSRSGAADYNYIQGMFLFERFQLYGIIGAAVAFTAPGLWVIKRYGRTGSGDRISISRKSLNSGTVIGSLLFGVGWSMTGMCPGPIFVNVGEGKLYALAALAGALAGASVFGMLFPRLQRLFRLPRLGVAAPAEAVTAGN
jgi:uncharacterized protein